MIACNHLPAMDARLYETARRKFVGLAREAVGHRNSRDVDMHPGFQAVDPAGEWGRPVLDQVQHGSGPVNKQLSQIGVAERVNDFETAAFGL